MSKSAWVRPFLMTPNFVDEIEVPAKQLKFCTSGLESRKQELYAALSRVFLVDDQLMAVFRKLLGIGEAHASQHYSSLHQIVGDIYSSNSWGKATETAVMLTGLAGVGKSECIRALHRIVAARGGTVDLPMHKGVPHIPVWHISLRDTKTLPTMLTAHLQLGKPEVDPSTSVKPMSRDKVLQLSRRASRRDGTCLVLVDELQFESNSGQASTRVTGLLLDLLSVGPRVVYVCNFSLAHKLTARRQEDKQRLLAGPIVMNPLLPGSEDLKRLLREYFSVLSTDFALDTEKDVEEIHRYTFGIKRAIVELLSTAWLCAKTVRGTKATVERGDLKSAYLSASYASYRQEVEELWKLTMGEKKIRPDYVCPFEDYSPKSSNVVPATAAIEHWQKQVVDSHLFDTLTPAERSAVDQLAPQGKPLDATRPKVVRLSRDASSKSAMLASWDGMEL